jgi:hypothetical protein
MQMFSKAFLAAMLIGLAAPSFSQALNLRWHGTWKSTEDTLAINDKSFKIGKEACSWANARPQKMTGCVAFYDNTISKAQLNTQFEQADKATKQMLKDGNLKQAQKDRIHDAMEKNKQALDGVSSDTFKIVHTSTEGKEKGSGDCASFYFLDKETIYFVLNCAPAPEAYTVRPYKKAP